MTSKSSKKKKSSVSTAMVHPIQNQNITTTTNEQPCDKSSNLYEPLNDKDAEQLCSSTMKPNEITLDKDCDNGASTSKSGNINGENDKIIGDDKSHLPEIGKTIKPQLVPESTIFTSISEVVTDVIPQNLPNPQHLAEQVLWVKIQNYSFDYKGAKTSHIIIFGLARGYQIWLVMDNGNIEEVVSERQGPLKTGHLLPFYPEPLHNETTVIDKFISKRPIMALIEAFSPTPESQFCQLSFLSFVTATVVTKIDFHEPIADIQSSNQCLLVLFANKIIILDQLTYTIHHEINNISLGSISTSNSNDLGSSLPAVALSGSFMAYVDKVFNKNLQSCGGAVIEEDSTSYTSQVFNVAKTITKSVGLFSSTPKSQVSSINNRNTISTSTNDCGIVTVIDIQKMSLTKGKVMQDPNEYTIAHFIAHDSPIGFLAFAPQSNILLTAPQTTTLLHLFNINVHSGCSSLTTINHLYTLHRGTSSARVIDASFSDDCRWLLVTTNHGTSHLFAINPYGGPVTTRTHGGKFVNKDGKFERSAGIGTEKVSSKGRNEKTNINSFFKEHPSVLFYQSLSKSVVNPRVQYATKPLNLSAVCKIKPRLFSTENFSAWASDNTFIDLTSMSKSSKNVNEGYTRKFESGRKIATKFVSSFSHDSFDGFSDKNPVQSLKQSILIVNNQGILTEYTINLKKERHNSNTSITSTTFADIFSSSPSSGSLGSHNNNITTQGGNSSPTQSTSTSIDPKMNVITIPKYQWVLQRTKSCVDIRLPIKENNPILAMVNDAKTSESFTPRSISPTIVQNNWVKNIEASTYSGPHRRIWMGPQITFAQYVNSEHLSADLITPSYDSNNFHGTGSSRYIPIVYDSNKSSLTLQNSAFHDNNYVNPYESSQIICSSSWGQNKEINLFDNKDETSNNIKKGIEEAMKEMSSISMDDFDRTDSIRLPSSISTSSSGGRSYSDSNQDLMQLSGMDL
ncbi:Breast carcinoma-amplified sequence 3 [Strongyloides ratti]|uniref:Breast carcinoma-amplified sequence 3 n=1 Tax=Strongyloides ratti TaxID=34506 RepID=A0A090LEV5_STRRB|nr:Breast carcinoma-amplified sequence 3 [Strongyloides ratti]CEF66673.1 Breast carcinoma-amplified sequence 3 [Strongyloides ratti]